jgi:hypothetical protein
VLLATILVLGPSSEALALDGAVTYLEPDPADRYRPVVVTASGETLLADIDSITPPAVSPSGSRVAFTGSLGNESLGLYAVFLVDIDGSDLVQLTQGSFGEMDPAWSPNGTRIAISQNQSGGITASNCCRLAVVDAASGSVTGLTSNIGAARPSYSPNGSIIVFDTPTGIWRIPATGGTATRIATVGYDATVSPDGQRVAYLVDVATGGTQLRVQSINGGSATTVFTTSWRVEAPHWEGSRISFFEFQGVGYDGRKNTRLRSVNSNGSASRVDLVLGSHEVGMGFQPGNDEIFFYRVDGNYAFYNISPSATLGSPIEEGSGFSSGWSSISAIDLEGDGTDEMLFYRETDGVFKYYDMRPDGRLGSLIREGTGYSTGWSSITAIDLDGDGQDEIFFYRTDGSFRFYDIGPTAALGSPLQGGTGFSSGWSSITAIDLDGDATDEMMFYRAADGVFKYYDVRSDGRLGSLIRSGSGYSTGWTSITSIDLDGDGQDEIFFYRETGAFAFYNIGPTASLGAPIQSGTGFSAGWTWVTAVDIDG